MRHQRRTGRSDLNNLICRCTTLLVYDAIPLSSLPCNPMNATHQPDALGIGCKKRHFHLIYA